MPSILTDADVWGVPDAVKADPIGLRQNNPGNIKLADGSGFQKFDTPEHGISATVNNLIAYKDKHGLNTVRGIISRWAPPSENDTESYIKDVAQHLGVGADDLLDVKNAQTLAQLTAAITHHENGKNPYKPEQISGAVDSALGTKSAVPMNDDQVFGGQKPLSDEEVFGAVPPVKPDFASRVGQDWEKRGQQAQDIVKDLASGKQTVEETGLQTAGMIAGGVGDVAGEALKSAGQGIADVTPDFIKKPVAAAGSAILNSDIGKAGLAALQQGVDAYKKFAEANPRAARDIEAVVNIGALLPAGKAPEAAAQAAEKIIPVVDKASGKISQFTKQSMGKTAEELDALSKKHDVPLSYGDITQNPGVKKTEILSEQIPVIGMGGFRKAQQELASQAAQNVTEDLRDEMINAPFKGMKELETAAQSGNKTAVALKNEIAASGDDWNEIVKNSGNLKAFRAKMIADKLYTKVGDLAGNNQVRIASTEKAVDDAIKEIGTAKIPDKSTLGLLETIQTSLKDKSSPNTFETLRKFRSDLGGLVNDYYKGSNAIVGQNGAGVIQKIKNAVEDDMQNFALKDGGVPGLSTAWKRADSFYKNQVVPYKASAIAKAFKGANTDEIYGQFIKSGKGSRAQNFYNALDPKGQAAVRYGMVNNALEKSTAENGVFSPAKFSQSLEKNKSASGVFFKGQDKFELDGFTKLMRHAERAGQYAENPPTGNRIIPLALAALAGTGSVLNAPVTAGVIGSTWLVKALFTTDAGKKLLLSIGSMEPGSPMMSKTIEKYMPEIMNAAKEAAAASAKAGAVQQTGKKLNELP